MKDWNTAGPQSGVKAVNIVLADTGPLAAGNYQIDILLAANIVLVVTLEHRNAANTTPSLKELVFCCNATTFAYCFPDQITLAEGERLRFTVRVATTASAGFQASIRTKKVG